MLREQDRERDSDDSESSIAAAYAYNPPPPSPPPQCGTDIGESWVDRAVVKAPSEAEGEGASRTGSKLLPSPPTAAEMSLSVGMASWLRRHSRRMASLHEDLVRATCSCAGGQYLVGQPAGGAGGVAPAGKAGGARSSPRASAVLSVPREVTATSAAATAPGVATTGPHRSTLRPKARGSARAGGPPRVTLVSFARGESHERSLRRMRRAAFADDRLLWGDLELRSDPIFTRHAHAFAALDSLSNRSHGRRPYCAAFKPLMLARAIRQSASPSDYVLWAGTPAEAHTLIAALGAAAEVLVMLRLGAGVGWQGAG